VCAGTYEFGRRVKTCSIFSPKVITATPTAPASNPFTAPRSNMLHDYPAAGLATSPTPAENGSRSRNALVGAVHAESADGCARIERDDRNRGEHQPKKAMSAIVLAAPGQELSTTKADTTNRSIAAAIRMIQPVRVMVPAFCQGSRT
jgi:hypothetical protein